jgi:hypothetical protein
VSTGSGLFAFESGSRASWGSMVFTV